MQKIEVINKVKTLKHGKYMVSEYGDIDVVVKSHQEYSDRIVLQIEDKEYTVIAEELKIAIENATNAS
jgi:hypothetical protein